ncbi:hypothetical protein SERLA73DRAFT_129902 [Serpula lacrymans var. lacrymans S7.3]|uniref:Uncharacterized protein n=2 Tax=Serpula lacrymans var. lacrymans TaxID=341189 RepID=F8PKA2_SERL3|nr:uncharacterized protein SERLADRAFT_378104 [Serpula lacrymans var. lacrymans S7.9]EGO03556.1 hypothetical protein SERLA73DRAFT_129902 [Serpula lacrymans var. lacrymans S7.3]EGO29365.1 hypothetical protein SERLADRAFT_378104 [Serpula lacrymans var. lacrymans S7.9]
MLEPKPIVAEPVPSSDGTTGDLDFANAKYSTETGDSGDENLEEYAEVDDPEEDGSEDEIDHEDSECTGW